MNLPQPIRDRVLIKPCESDSTTAGGIEVPLAFRERSNKAVVQAVGNGLKNEPMRYSKGMTVLNVKDAGVEIICEGEKYYLISQKDILAHYGEPSTMDRN